MNPEIEKYEHIEKYLLNRLSGTEKDAFEERMLLEAGFAEEVEKHRLVNELLIDEGLLQLKQQMKSGQFAQSGPTGKIWWYTGGAAILVGSLVVTYFMLNNSPSNVEDKTKYTVAEQIPTKEFQQTDNKLVVVDNSEVSLQAKAKQKQPLKAGKQANTTQYVDDSSNASTLHENKSIDVVSPIVSTPEPLIQNKTTTDEKPVEKVQKEVNTKSVSIQVEPSPDKSDPLNHKNTDYIFYPERGESWKIPVENNGDLKIFSRTGEIIYQAQIREGLGSNWNGTNKDGIAVSMGTYIFIFTDQNGNLQQGTVTVAK